MGTPPETKFHLDNYPKSFGSIDGWRLSEYLHLPVADQEQIYKHLEHFCLHHAKQSPVVSEHQGYQHLGSGWEWSVFAKDENVVVKVPAGVFPEVNSPEYLANAQKAYELMRQYYPQNMVANTKFYHQNNLNIVEQDRMNGQDWTLIDVDQADEWLLRKLVVFFEGTAALIQEQCWLPDFWLDYDPAGFALRNVMVNPATDQFTIIDFTSYLDPARMYPALCDHHCQKNAARVQQMLGATKRALKRLEQS